MHNYDLTYTTELLFAISILIIAKPPSFYNLPSHILNSFTADRSDDLSSAAAQRHAAAPGEHKAC